MLAKGVRQCNNVFFRRANAIRQFGSQVASNRTDKNGLAEVLKHDDGHGDHHHDHVHPAPLDHKFIADGVDKKLIALHGLKATKNATVAIDNEFHQLNDVSMFQ